MRAQKFITEANKHEVCKLLGMTEEVYCQYQEQQGLEYLRLQMGTDLIGIDQMAKNELYWKWWINHWNHRDEEFLTYGKGMPYKMRLKYYHSLNSVEGFEFRPHKKVIEESYRILNEDLLPLIEPVHANH